MSSILSTQNRHSFLRRKYCFFPAMALSPPVGLDEPLIGLPPRCSATIVSSYPSLVSAAATLALGSGKPGAAAAGAPGAAGDGAAGIVGDAMGGGGGLRAARLSRCFFRFSIFLVFSSIRT